MGEDFDASEAPLDGREILAVMARDVGDGPQNEYRRHRQFDRQGGGAEEAADAPATPARVEASRVEGRFLGSLFSDLSATLRHS
jgi:hypothetical protein